MNETKKEYVLDSFALLALVEGEMAAEQVAAVFKETEERGAKAYLSKINEGEVYYILYRTKGNIYAEQLRRDLKSGKFPLEIVSAIDGRVEKASEIKARFPLSYADAFAAQLAIERGALLVTGDAEFKSLAEQGLLKVMWLPSARGARKPKI